MTPLRRRATLLAILVLAFAARIANLRGVFSGGDVVLFATDSYYHLRRAWLAGFRFPHVPSFDYFSNYPEGSHILWGPGMDLLVAGVARISAGGPPDIDWVAQVGAWIPVVLGVSSVGLVYLTGREAFGEAAGLMAAGFFALLPLEVAISAIGNFDHHVAEILFFAAALFCLLRSLRSRRSSIAAPLGGVAMAAGLVFWPGATLAAALLSGSAMAATATRWVMGGEPDPGIDLLRDLAIALGMAAFLFAPFAFTGAQGAFGPWSYQAASWFQETVLLLLALMALLLRALVGWRPRSGRIDLRHAVAAVTGILLLGGLLLLVVPDLRHTLAEGIGRYLLRGDPVLRGVLESQPMTSWPMREILRVGTVLVLLAPALIAWALTAFRRGRGADLRLGLVAWLALATAPLLVMQFHRYGPYHLLPLALLAGWALAAGPAPSARWRRGVAVLVLLAFVPVAFLVLRPTRIVNGHLHFGPVREALEWMRYNTPPTRGLRDPDAMPQYGVLALWDYGHWLNVIGERANIANPFGLAPWHLRGVVRSAAVFLEADAGRAARMCERWRARYVLVTTIMPYLQGFASMIGRDPQTYGFTPDHAGLKPAAFRALGTRLLFTDGGPAQDGSGRALPPLDRFCLVYESPYSFTWDFGAYGDPPPGYQERRIPSIKIYEVVTGALLVGRTLPFHPVRVEVAVRTNTGRTLVWRGGGLSGPEGRFRFRVPYPTGVRWREGRTSSPEPYRVSCAGREVSVSVDEPSVREGRSVQVDCGSEAGPSARPGRPQRAGPGAAR